MLLAAVLGTTVLTILVGAVVIKGPDNLERTGDTGPSIRAGEVSVGAPVPAFGVPIVSGGTFRMPSEQPTILTFIDLCPTCIDDVRTIGTLQRQFGNVAVLAVASDPTADVATLRGFVDQAGDFDFALALDPQSTLTQRFNAISMAASVFVTDPRGMLIYRGPADPEALDSALRKAGATT